ncbi:MAG: hypothetical protein M3004_12375 [Bacteroidota bacterium]|nr:hypothetical protein [Bacteroidota bacterium]
MNPKFIIGCLLGLSFLGCKKSNSTGGGGTYITLSANSTWNYQQTNNATLIPVVTNYTITSTNKDTLINGRNYHIFNNSTRAKQYSNVSGHEYYQYDSLPIPNVAAIERLYLRDDVAANNNWVQNISVNIPGVPLAIPIVITNIVSEKGISRTVNSISYTDVIHVQTSITSIVIPATSFVNTINSYYAPKFGLIENISLVQLNYAGYNQNINSKTILLSAVLK